MTRRQLTGAAASEVESQSRDTDVSDSLSEESSQLPSYQDAVGNTPSDTSDNNDNDDKDKLKSEEKKVSNHNVHAQAGTCDSPSTPPLLRSEQDHTVPPFHDDDPETGLLGEQHQTSPSRVEERRQEDKPSTLKDRIRPFVFRILLCGLLFYVFFRGFRSGMHKTPPSPSEPESTDTPWPSPREVRIHQNFGAIHGTYPLYDLLDISTVTGAVHITVEPKPGDKPAILRISSQTGAIHIRFARSPFLASHHQSGHPNQKAILDRTYNTQIETATGQIHGELFHGGPGGATVVTANTGMIDLRIVPVSDQASQLETSTKTGMSKIVVDAPLSGATLRNLTALHKSKASGMLDLQYPRVWEGKLHAWSEGPGYVDVRGQGLTFQRGGNDVYASRGRDALEKGKVIEAVSEGTGMVKFSA